MRIVLLIVALLFLPVQTFACSCYFEVDSLREKIADKTIFIGRAKESRFETYINTIGLTRPRGVTTFAIEECWQGDCDTEVVLQHHAHPSSCQITFPLNEPRFLIAYRDQSGSLRAGSECMAFHPGMVEHVLKTFEDFKYPGPIACETAEEKERPSSEDLVILNQCRRWISFEEKLRPEYFWLQDQLRK